MLGNAEVMAAQNNGYLANVQACIGYNNMDCRIGLLLLSKM
jgi:hypothetical protein